MTTLKEKFKDSLIPTVQRMIEKESAHLEKMQKAVEEHPHILQAHQFVERSKKDLAHYKTRLKEYQEYTEKL